MTHTDVLLAILQSTPDYVLAVRREGYELIWANRAFCDYCRQSHGIEMTPGLSFSGLPGAREAEPIWHEWFERVSREGNFSTEYIVPESGTSLQLTLSLLGDPADPRGVSVIARDSSAQRQMEARLAVNESLYSSLVNAMAEGAVFQAADGRIVALNPAAERIEGRSRDDMLGKTSDDPGWGAVRDDGSPFPGEEHPAMVTLRTGKALSDVVMGIRQPSGERRWISINSEPVYSQGGPLPDAVVTTFHDITQQRAVEADLRVAAIAFEQSQEAMLITDADMKILKVNRAFSEITGYAMEDAIGQTPRLLSSGLQDQDFYRALWDEVASSDHWQGEIWNRRKSGELYPEWLSINAVRDEQGRLTHYVGTFLDLSEHKEAEATIHTLTYNDALTGLPNRHFLLMRLQELLAGTVRSRQSALLFVDLDDFKLVNEALGHATADRLLAACARAMRARLKSGDILARLGNDEFAVLVYALPEDPEATAVALQELAKRLQRAIGEAAQEHQLGYAESACIGITQFRSDDSNLEDIMKHADASLFQARMAGKGAIHFFDPEVQRAMEQRALLITELHQAIPSQLRLYLQPQVDTRGQLVGAEALVRWEHPQRGMVSPASFIPLAEETGLILPMGRWVLEAACAQLRRWRESPATRHLVLAINVSAAEFQQPDFVGQVLDAIRTSGIEARRLKLELTESLLADDIDAMTERMLTLRQSGVCFALDDFGTGFSSLSYLRRLPLDELKIDQSFVRNIAASEHDAAIVRTIIALGKSLGLGVIAEGVETAEQKSFLRAMGCDLFQGYLIGPPAPSLALPG